MSSCNNNKDEQASNPINMLPPPPAISYSVVNTYPHDTASFTQGLQLYNGILYEGTGGGNPHDTISKLLKTDLKTGKQLQAVKLAPIYFGEGITILNDTLYQITWNNKTCFVYDAKSLKQLKTFNYDSAGWGLTNDSTNLIMSDGSSNLYYKDPTTFKTIKIVGVTDNNGPVASLNELEYVDGFIYANIWNANYILKIDPSNGQVVGRMDFAGLLEQAGQPGPDSNVGNVLNGIAYDAARKSFYITGKLWPLLFEVKLQ